MNESITRQDTTNHLKIIRRNQCNFSPGSHASLTIDVVH